MIDRNNSAISNKAFDRQISITGKEVKIVAKNEGDVNIDIDATTNTYYTIKCKRIIRATVLIAVIAIEVGIIKLVLSNKCNIESIDGPNFDDFTVIAGQTKSRTISLSSDNSRCKSTSLYDFSI